MGAEQADGLMNQEKKKQKTTRETLGNNPNSTLLDDKIKWNSNKNLIQKKQFNKRNSVVLEKYKKNIKNETNISTPNINNYQNNFYVQYTTPRKNDGFNFDPNKNNNYDINEFENDSINLSFLADKIVQCFDLDKKDSDNVLIEELPIQNEERNNKTNLNKNNIKNKKSFEDNKMNLNKNNINNVKSFDENKKNKNDKDKIINNNRKNIKALFYLKRK